MKSETIVAFSHTKKRNMIGMVGIEVDLATRITYPRLARQWKREDMDKIPSDVKRMYEKIQWGATYADQLVGQHLLKSIEHTSDIAIFAINTQKNIKEPEDQDEPMKTMDLIEMTQFLLSRKQTHKIQFPEKPTKEMLELIQQTEMFTENITEQGTVNYYAPGEELDCLIKSLMIACFAGRPYIEEAQMPFMIVQGVSPKSQTKDMQDTLAKLLKNKKPNPLFGYTPGILK